MIDIMIKQYFLYILLAVATIFCYFWLSQFKKKLRIGEGKAFLIAVLHTVIGLLCVKLFAFIEGNAGGMSLYGGIFFMPVFYFVVSKLTKRNIADVFDIFAVCMVFTLLCARVNCLRAGCCPGLPIPWMEGVCWPTREVEILFYIILLAVLFKITGKPKYHGKIYPIYLVSYGIFRFIEEWFRDTTYPVKTFHISHIWSIVAVAIGIMVLCMISRKNKSGHKDRESKKL